MNLENEMHIFVQFSKEALSTKVKNIDEIFDFFKPNPIPIIEVVKSVNSKLYLSHNLEFRLI